MDKADRNGLGLALAGHALLLAALTIGIARRPPPMRPAPPIMDVQLVDTVGLQSAAPEPATEAPQEATAPEAGPPEEAPAPAPEPAPVPTPPKPVEKPTPAPPTPKPTPAPAPTPKKAEKPKEEPKPKDAPRLSSDFLKDLKSTASKEAKGASAGAGTRSTATRLGPNFLKGIVGPSAGKGTAARAPISGAAMNGLGAAIKRQVQPCYDLGALGGTPAMQIVTVLRLRFNKDGSVDGAPQVIEQTGVDGSNARYKQQMAEVSRAAVLRCSPLHLPAELYEGGWEQIDMGFTPGQMQR